MNCKTKYLQDIVTIFASCLFRFGECPHVYLFVFIPNQSKPHVFFPYTVPHITRSTGPYFIQRFQLRSLPVRTKASSIHDNACKVTIYTCNLYWKFWACKPVWVEHSCFEGAIQLFWDHRTIEQIQTFCQRGLNPVHDNGWRNGREVHMPLVTGLLHSWFRTNLDFFNRRNQLHGTSNLQAAKTVAPILRMSSFATSMV